MHESNTIRQSVRSACRVLALAMLLALCPWLWASNDTEATAGPERLYFTIVSTITDQDRGDVHEHRFSVGTIEAEPARISTVLQGQRSLDYIVSYELPDDPNQVLLSIELVHDGQSIDVPRILFEVDSENSAFIQATRETGLSYAIEIEASRQQPGPL
ncbi:hypothetical protein [Wenzhouxiangella marina]|uniref:Uncharacterized protein n=1 Tax=Wenzhouxiangella marina TaxID=1579979 RepID=A0A0K0XUI8_9GAMM|nr:hypothetical protein [Wenzhouxiangella marina]AKS41287.1 hypothetical protein WM2015_906 [Wenzhouxiangella marina]MBB6086963.1 hypothetical protein [Wenzhouxiangella marina]